MANRFALVLSVLSLLLGLAAAPVISSAIRGYVTSRGLPERSVTYVLLWVGAYTTLVAVVLALALSVSWWLSVIARPQAGKAAVDGGPLTVREKIAQEERARRDLEVRRRALQKVLDTADDIAKMLDTLSRELAMESSFDLGALRRLQEAMVQADKLIQRASAVVVSAGIPRLAPEIGAVLQSITRHSQQEVVSVLLDTNTASRDEGGRKVRRASWGIACVRLLVEQLREILVQHPAYRRDRQEPRPIDRGST